MVKRFCVVLLIAALSWAMAPPVSAGTVGTISGTITDVQTHAPLADVRVAAASASATRVTTTNARGFFAMTGVIPDTYTVSFQLNGYQPVAIEGVSVYADQSATVNTSMRRSLKTIASVQARSAGSAFQPNQTHDTYTVTSQQVLDMTGNTLTTSADNLLQQIPGVIIGGGVSTPSYWQYPVIRGGKGDAVDYEIDGVPLNDAYHNVPQDGGDFNFNIQALSQLQVTPGLSDASFGNSGQGDVNELVKMGTYPSFFNADLAIGGGQFNHSLDAEYGIATPNHRWSNYVSLNALNISPVYGDNRYPLSMIGQVGQRELVEIRNFTDKLTYGWGPGQKYQLRALYVNNLTQALGGQDTVPIYYYNYFNPNDGLGPQNSVSQGYYCYTPGQTEQQFLNSTCWGGLTSSDLQNMLQLMPGQTQLAQLSPWGADIYGQNIESLGFTDLINSSTTLQLSGYHTYISHNANYVNAGIQQLNGGFNNGARLDFTKEFGESHLVKVGFSTDDVIPTQDYGNQSWVPYSVFTNWWASDPNAFNLYDFLPPSQPCPMNSDLRLPANSPSLCGYLYQYFPGAKQIKLPSYIGGFHSRRNDLGYYINDHWTPTSRLAVDLGLHVDAANYVIPSPGFDLATCTTAYLPFNYQDPVDAKGNPLPIIPGKQCPTADFPEYNHDTVNPHIVEPRFGASYLFSPDDALRVNAGRTARFQNFGQNEVYYALSDSYASQFEKIPSFFSAGNYCDPNLSGAGVGTPFCSNFLANPQPNAGVGFYNASNPFPCPASNPNPPCGNPNYPFPPAGVQNPSGMSNTCGNSGHYVPCVNYAEQLWYEEQGTGAIVNPVAPTTYNEWSLTYEHQFANGIGRGFIQSLTHGLGFSVTNWGRTSNNEDVYISQPLYVNGKLQRNAAGAVVFLPAFEQAVGQSFANGFEGRLTRTVPYGLSVQFAFTVTHAMSWQNGGNELTGNSVDNLTVLHPQFYPEDWITPLATTWDLSYTTHSGWRIATQIFWNKGYPTGAGLLTPTLLNNNYTFVPKTNASYGCGSACVTQYVDPGNPGPIAHPNIAATSGTPEGAQPWSQWTPPSSSANLTLEKMMSRKLTLGFTVNNLLDTTYGYEQLNDRYQPVATGISR